MKSIPKYARVREVISQQIKSGELSPGDKLLSEEEYAKLHGVSTITVRKALADLVTEGLIVRTKSKGTFVREPQEDQSASKLVALILSPEDYYDISYMQIIKGAQRMMADNEYSLIVEWGDKDFESERATILKMIDRQVDGFLIYPFDPVQSRENYRLIKDAGIPYVQIDRYDIDASDYFVGCNNYEGGMLATRKLLELGHRSICFGAYQFFLSSELERYDGFCSAMRQAGIELAHSHLLNGIDYDTLRDQILAGEVTALFCCNDKLAVKAVRQLMERGIRIPEDVSVMGFDDWEGNRDIPMGLTTMRQDFAALGQMAAHLLINVINGNTVSNLKMLVGVTLVERDTVSEYQGNKVYHRQES
ncbi:MAG: substrate-binding domain-containing protein [Oscillospiraceae bacterium]